ncbi:hypothetical protein DL96DRAFT_1822340 [Flagelloscypha sp. PMI_526]|nr:hypothetical protein DL96DRAFT_1822340 [Flagelloscypha sp. PMI_526]
MPSFLRGLSSSSDIELLATAWIRFQALLQIVNDGKPPPHKISRLIDNQGPLYLLEQSSDGQFLFVVNNSGIQVWNLQTPSPALVDTFEIDIPEDCSPNLSVVAETCNSFLVYLLLDSQSHRIMQWLAFRFEVSAAGQAEYHLDLLSQLDLLGISARSWYCWASTPTVPFLVTCIRHSSESTYYVLWNPVADVCAIWPADVNDTIARPDVFMVSNFIIACDHVSQDMVVYARPEIPPKSSYAPEMYAKLNNPALLHVPGNADIEHNLSSLVTAMYRKTYANQGHPVSDRDIWAVIHRTGDQDWFLERSEICRTDSSPSTFNPLPLKHSRRRYLFSSFPPIDTFTSGTFDISIDQNCLVHVISKTLTQVIFHLSSSDENGGGVELGRGVLYDTGRLCIGTPNGIEVIDFVDSPYLHNIPTVQRGRRRMPISELFNDSPKGARRNSVH